MNRAFSFTEHARMRMAQRGISTADVEYVLLWGHRIRSGGVEHIHLRAKDIPAGDQRRCSHLEGIQVLSDPLESVVITAYKNRSKGVLLRARRKVKYDRGEGRGASM